jgi:NAD(P)H-hydrate epimerase
MNTRFDPATGEVPGLTSEQMVEVDRAMIEDYGIELIQMMENAGRNLAHLARERFLDRNPQGKHVIVLVGRGGNGGGAMACARRLSNWGAFVSVYLTKEAREFHGVPAQQLSILNRMQLPISQPGDTVLSSESSGADVIVDGLIGYSLSGSPRGTAAELIRWANEQSAPTLSLDTPSGLDTATGKVFDPTIKATATLTLALPKQGLRTQREEVGELYLADISVPPALYENSLGLKVGPLFAESDVIRLQ